MYGLLFDSFFLTIVVLLAYIDFKKRVAPDLLCSVLWVWVVLFSINTPGLLLFFVLWYLAYAVHPLVYGQLLFGLGDVLAVPPIVAVMAGKPYGALFMAGGFLLAGIAGVMYKQKTFPLLPFTGIAYILFYLFTLGG
jgi:hypothetical protein